MKTQSLASGVVLLALAWLAGCTGDGTDRRPADTAGSGNMGGSGGSGGGFTGAIPDDGTRGTPLIARGANSTCSMPTAGRPPLRRISRVEYNNTVAQLFGDASAPAADFVAEEKAGGFNSNITTPVTDHNITEYVSGAEEVAAHVLANFGSVTGCLSTADGNCIEPWLARTARQAFHGVFPDDEKAQLLADYEAAFLALDADSAATLAIESILVSPRFLYVVEFGQGSNGIVALAPAELAGRLALTLWRGAPDDALLAAADNGQLASAAGVTTQARRMLADSKAGPMLDDFVTQWLDIPTVDGLAKDPTKFPNFTPQVRASLVQETEQTFRAVADAAVSVDQLFTLPYTMANADVASFYGISAAGSGFSRVNLPAGRAGLLTNPAVLAAHAHPVQPAPVLRGKMVRVKVICDPINDPPPNVQRNLADPMPGQTEQDVQEAHLTNAACVGCHQYMDPIGFGFNHFDASGGDIGTAGGSDKGSVLVPQLATVKDISGDFLGAVELGQKLAASEQVKQCFAMQTLRYAIGRDESTADACSAAQAWQQFKASGYSIKEALVAVVSSDTFRYRTSVHAGASCQ